MSRRDFYPTINTTYGRVTIFRKDESISKVDERDLKIKEITNKFQQSLKSEQKVEINEKNVEQVKNEDFYGITENDDKMNYIDEVYFKNNNEESSSIPTMTTNNVTTEDLQNQTDLNYMDANLFGTLNKEEIPLIQNNNIHEEKRMEILKQLSTKKQNQERAKPAIKADNENYHKVISGEVLQWHKMTIDEGAKILMNNICHYNINHGIFAIDKPYGLPSTGGPGVHLSVAKLMPRLKQMLKIDYDLYMMHRLDEYTTGVMMFATNKDAEMKLRNLFNERKVIKQYLAITKNIPKPAEGEIDIPLLEREVNGINKIYLSHEYNDQTKYVLNKPTHDNSKRHNAVTKYRVLDANYASKCALVECQPMTGQKHQIRVHLSFGLDCPILGDHKYSHHLKLAPQKLAPETLRNLNIRQSKARYIPMHLHAYRIILPEFFDNSNLFINAKLPYHFVQNLKRLKLRFI